MIHPIKDFQYYKRFYVASRQPDLFEEIGMPQPSWFGVLLRMWRYRHEIPIIFRKNDIIMANMAEEQRRKEEELQKFLELEPKYSPDSPWLQKEVSDEAR